MLPDTLGTDAFMLAAKYIQVDNEPFITKINKARQDSGTTEGFKKKMAIWKYKGELMASEIEDTNTLERANKQGYNTFGAGGFFGDSEKVWNVSIDNQVSNAPVNNKPFSASMAVKAIRVLVSNTDKEINRYPVKLGDGTGKETAYTRLSTDKYNQIIEEKKKLKEKGVKATEALEALEEPGGKKDITKQNIMSILKKIISNESPESNQQESNQQESISNESPESNQQESISNESPESNQQESTQELFDEIVDTFKSLDNKSNNTAEQSTGGNRIRKTRKKRRNGNYLHNKSKRRNGNYLHNKSKRRNGNYLHNKSKRKGGKRRTRRL
jgi:hypothetical protein